MSEPERAGVLLIHWGRRNAGPLLLREYVDALRPPLADRLHVSGNRAVESAVRPDARVTRFDVDTYSSPAGVVVGLPRLVRQALGLRRYIRRSGVGTVFAPMFSVWQTLALHLWLPRDVRYVTTVHDAADHPGERHPVRSLCRRIELGRADAAVVYSDQVERAVRALARTVPTVRLELGAPPAGRPRGRAADRPIIGFFGRLVAYKGLDVFVETVRMLAADRDVRGVVHGYGVVPPETRLAGGDDVDWRIGYVGEDEVLDVLRSFDVSVLPYQEASQSGVVLQSFAAGVPVVVTPVGGLREQAEERGGFVADGTDARSLAAAVARVLDDAELYAQLSATAVRTAEERSWPAVAAPLLRLLDEVHG